MSSLPSFAYLRGGIAPRHTCSPTAPLLPAAGQLDRGAKQSEIHISAGGRLLGGCTGQGLASETPVPAALGTFIIHFDKMQTFTSVSLLSLNSGCGKVREGTQLVMPERAISTSSELSVWVSEHHARSVFENPYLLCILSSLVGKPPSALPEAPFLTEWRWGMVRQPHPPGSLLCSWLA